MLHTEKLSEAEANRTYPYIQRGKYLHTKECPFIDESSTERSSGFERIEDALKQQIPLCGYCIGEYVDPQPTEIKRVDPVRIHRLQEMCKMFGFRSELHGELLFIITGVATWFFNIEKCTSLYHNNHVFADRRKSGIMNFHKQPRKFISPEEIIRYINKHDKAVITGKSLRMAK